jgi:hypothetical protein
VEFVRIVVSVPADDLAPNLLALYRLDVSDHITRRSKTHAWTSTP